MTEQEALDRLGNLPGEFGPEHLRLMDDLDKVHPLYSYNARLAGLCSDDELSLGFKFESMRRLLQNLWMQAQVKND